MDWVIVILEITCFAFGFYYIFKGLKLKEESLNDEKRNVIKNIKGYILANRILNILVGVILIVIVGVFNYPRIATIIFVILGIIYNIIEKRYLKK
ncbi:hypothetical protein [Clostridium sp. JNZ J1-5]|nr:hypothetical protein [Clostridium sp.]